MAKNVRPPNAVAAATSKPVATLVAQAEIRSMIHSGVRSVVLRLRRTSSYQLLLQRPLRFRHLRRRRLYHRQGLPVRRRGELVLSSCPTDPDLERRKSLLESGSQYR